MDLNFQPFFAYLPNLLIALAILIIGWLIALVVSRLIGSLLRRTTLDDRIASFLASGGETEERRRYNVEGWISGAVFWLIMLFVIIAFLQQLNLGIVSQPLSLFLSQILAYIPGILGALVLLFLAFLIASFLRVLIIRVLGGSEWFSRLTDTADVREPDQSTITRSIGNIVYWLVFLLFLPAILDALNLQGILLPVQQLVNQILSFLPNLLGAALILILGWLVARIIRQIVTNLLAGLGIDNLLAPRGAATGRVASVRLSEVLGTVVYVLILIPVVIAALNALNIPAVSQPAANMLNNLLVALPNIFGALLLIAIAFFVGRLVGRFVADILASLGFDNLFTWMGLYRPRPSATLTTPAAATPPGPAGSEQESRRIAAEITSTTPSQVVGTLVTVAIILFAVMEAANLLGFGFLATLVAQFIVAAGQVLLGLIIFAIGLYLASLADRLIRSTGTSQANVLAPAARIAIIIFSGALALRQMGIAEDIVNLAFGLLLGAVAVAAALAFGLGGREVAGRQLERWRQDLSEVANRPPEPPPPAPGPLGGVPPSPTPPPSSPPLDPTSNIE
jgi:hypothetical protein